MTRIEFHHGAHDKIEVARRLTVDCLQQGRRVVLYSQDAHLRGLLDRQLWIQPALSFLPHVDANSPLAAETPAVLAGDLDRLPHDDVLVNLDADVPPGFQRFRALIEVVGQDESDRVPARDRYRFYRERGYEIESIALGQGGGNDR